MTHRGAEYHVGSDANDPDETVNQIEITGSKGVLIHGTQINQFPSERQRARSPYLHLVRQIVPEGLKDRDEELRQLVAFCREPEPSHGYLFWKAGPWAGKTALLSSFVLDPPREAEIVSFFITRRFPGQSDHGAFLNVVIEQLATLLGEPIPPNLVPESRPAHFLELLDAAAKACRGRGKHLVVVVDGLDEDTGAAQHSIAALLPHRPPTGVRIVASGRSIPADVPPGHPLRRSEQILAPSVHAEGIRIAAEPQLDRLLQGDKTEQQLLGLIAAAGGGLDGEDLSELTNRRLSEVQETLRSSSGRVITRKSVASPIRSAASREIYLLGHEELQQAAVKGFGREGIQEYREQLHAWAELYRGLSWPTDTPEYLLRGYFSMLQADGDLSRMADCALDVARHDRLFEVTGGDVAALAEISATQDAFLSGNEPDLRVLTLLSLRKEQITGRNSDIPSNLPAVWALTGKPERAEALARSIPVRGRQLVALAAVIRALNDRQDDAYVHALVEEVVAFAATVHVSDRGASSGLIEVSIAVAKAGYLEEAYKVAAAIADLLDRSSALAGVARAAAEAGQIDFAERTARSVSADDRLGMVRAQQEIAEALAGTDAIRARAAARRADTIAHSITDPLQGPWALARAASTLAAVGLNRRAATVAERMENLARSRATYVRQDHFAGQLGDAAKAWAQAGRAERAHAVAAEAEHIARSITTGDVYESLAWGHVVRAWGAVGEPGRAEQAARSITDQRTRLLDLAAVAPAWAEEGDFDRAEEIIRSIGRSTHSSGVSDAVDRATAQVVQILTAAGEIARAEEITKIITDPGQRAREMAEVACAWAEAGEAARARAVGRMAEELARGSTNPSRMLWDLERVVDSLAASGHMAEARVIARRTWDLANRLPDPTNQVRTLSRTAGAVVAIEVVQRAEKVARTITDPHELASAHKEIAMAWGRLEDFDRAEDILSDIPESDGLPWAWQEVAWSAARTGDFDRAEELALSITMAESPEHAVAVVAHTLAGVARAAAQAGEADRATALLGRADQCARDAADPLERARELSEVARAWADMGEVDRARVTALDAEAIMVGFSDALLRSRDSAGLGWDHEMADWTWSTVAPACAAAGDIAHAEEIAWNLVEPAYRADALVGVAEYAGPTQAHRLVAHALQTGRWQRTISALATMAPSVLTDIAQETLTRLHETLPA
ncbi:hypothetical protein ACFQ6E_11795 [Streptomyces sp. NPDC056462]|uniref:hypothetical protein n=1 Tax=Streptomyces sp. NPDC056462 TaxID=3345826 RepID=UPI0036B195BB